MEQRDTKHVGSSSWWTQGDMPVREGCLVEPLIDGRAAMFAMCKAFLTARRFILLAGWDLQVDLPMVRGGDAHMLEDGISRDPGITEWLSAQGFDDETIAFWMADNLRVVDILGYAVKRGVKVGVLLWDAFHLGSHVTNNPVQQREALEAVGVDCLLDDSSRSIKHITQSLHQKCCVVDGQVAFVGGIDLTVQDGGDYDRWDTHHHPCASAERVASRSAAAHPWHDIHSQIQGPAVADVLQNILQRWSEVAARHHGALWPSQLPQVIPDTLPGGATAQIARTIPPNTYQFAPHGIATIRAAYMQAINQAQQFIYLENQYLWPEVFIGLDNLRWGERSPEIMEVIEALRNAIKRGVHVALTLPDHPNCGRQFTDGGVQLLRGSAAEAGDPLRLGVFTLGSAESEDDAPGGILYRPVYTHGKVAIVDDSWWTVGSANLNSRGMYSDAEINVTVLDPASARLLRHRLFAEHLRRDVDDLADLESPTAVLARLRELATGNREHVRKREPLDGHILPYLTEQDGKQLGLPVHAEHGWLDNLEGGSGAMPAAHAGRYL
jgi:phosphatidylserine/phosphatidylglycerophosphate/cardiolipin synthase-like enzyme